MMIPINELTLISYANALRPAKIKVSIILAKVVFSYPLLKQVVVEDLFLFFLVFEPKP